jgi:DNA-binding NarL/FixJ family response regulator
MKLLIVSNNALLLRMARSVVAQVAAEIRECASEAEAVTAYETFGPDFVLTDEAASSITAAHPEARVIVLTDSDDGELHADVVGGHS